MFTKIFKIIFFFILVAALFLTVDFNDFSFKTIKPPPKTEISSDGSPKKGIRKQNPVEALPQGERKFQGSQTDIIRLANEAREGKGLSSLEENAKLSLSARKKAEHMKKNDYFDHVSPNGLQPWYFAEKVEYNYKTFGENLAEGYFSAQSVHEGWMNSPGHRENIMSEKFEEMGVAIVESSQGNRKSYLIVQHFGSPLKEKDLVEITVCEKESRENCKEAEDREEELDEIIEKQERIIEEAKEKGAREEDLEDALDNLEKLKENEDELEDYLEECEEFIDKCDEWR